MSISTALQAAANEAAAFLVILVLQAVLKKAAWAWTVVGGNLSNLIEQLGWWRREQTLC
ncbi:hypothetical protein GCAAIG_05020 [Candidatus Electronema halotolerans]